MLARKHQSIEEIPTKPKNCSAAISKPPNGSIETLRSQSKPKWRYWAAKDSMKRTPNTNQSRIVQTCSYDRNLNRQPKGRLTHLYQDCHQHRKPDEDASSGNTNGRGPDRERGRN